MRDNPANRLPQPGDRAATQATVFPDELGVLVSLTFFNANSGKGAIANPLSPEFARIRSQPRQSLRKKFSVALDKPIAIDYTVKSWLN
jgi:hypothetical protein